MGCEGSLDFLAEVLAWLPSLGGLQVAACFDRLAVEAGLRMQMHFVVLLYHRRLSEVVLGLCMSSLAPGDGSLSGMELAAVLSMQVKSLGSTLKLDSVVVRRLRDTSDCLSDFGMGRRCCLLL